jgi:hypothetical protein
MGVHGVHHTQRSRKEFDEMGADYCLVYFGIRQPMTGEEMRRLQWDDTSYVRKAERIGLDYRLALYSYIEEQQFYLYIGREIGLVGGEYEDDKAMERARLMEITTETRAKLQSLGFSEEPSLYIQWVTDI